MNYGTQQHPTQILSLASRLRTIHLAHLLRRAMPAIRYRREQGGMATLFEKSHQETSEGRGDEYFWVQGYRTPDKGRKAVAHQMGREEKTVHGEAVVSRQDGATENQLYSERAERGL